jgi:manganese transport protein
MPPDHPMTMTDRTVLAGYDALAGERNRWRSFLPFAGPGIVASIAYMDPGNFATNISAGAQYNYDLLWVVLVANLIAMLFQAMSAKLGIVTGRNLAELSRDHFPRPIVWIMWVISEIAAMATDLAEFLGGAIALALLFNLPLLTGMGITAVVTYGILLLQTRGFRPIELIIASFVGVIGACYLIEIVIAPPDWLLVASSMATPKLADTGAVLLAVGIVGATVMPHAIYLHSSLTQDRIVPRSDAERRRLLSFSNREVVLALGFAGLVNMAMVAMAASVFYQSGHQEIADIESAYATLIPLLGAGAAWVFLTALMASGLSSSVVGTMAGQIIMQGFINFRIPLWLRRLVTMLPAFVIVGYGINATEALVMSQVVLSLAVPVPMIALVLLSRRRILGDYVSNRAVTTIAVIGAGIVVGLNLLLLWKYFF